MKILSKILSGGSISIALILGFVHSANADPIYCSTVSKNKNYMSVDDSQVRACLLSGVGNISGKPARDVFLNSAVGSAYSLASKVNRRAIRNGRTGNNNPFNITFAADGSWSFDASFWNTHSDGAIAFKFGTGNNPDEWFVFSLEQGVSSGTWNFYNVFGKGKGLRRINLYGIPINVPEPGTLALFGLGLLAIGFRRRRQSR